MNVTDESLMRRTDKWVKDDNDWKADSPKTRGIFGTQNSISKVLPESEWMKLISGIIALEFKREGALRNESQFSVTFQSDPSLEANRM